MIQRTLKLNKKLEIFLDNLKLKSSKDKEQLLMWTDKIKDLNMKIEIFLPKLEMIKLN